MQTTVHDYLIKHDPHTFIWIKLNSTLFKSSFKHKFNPKCFTEQKLKSIKNQGKKKLEDRSRKQ